MAQAAVVTVQLYDAFGGVLGHRVTGAGMAVESTGT